MALIMAGQLDAYAETEPSPAPQATPAAAVPAAIGQTPAARNTVTCESKLGNDREHCAVGTSAGVALVKSTGSAPCLVEKTRGYDVCSSL